MNVDTYAKSAKFGRAQHRLVVGNRLGMSITATPDKLALKPYDGLRVSAAGYSATYAVNGLNFSFGRDGIVASVDALFIGGNGLNTTKRKSKTKSLPPCWFYLPPDYDETNLPSADDGQVIPPFNEQVNVQGGIKLGTRVVSQLAQNLIPQTVEIGVALGIDGTVANYKQLAEVGVAAGVEATGTLAYESTVGVGVKLGANYIRAFTAPPVGVGVKLGVNVGPAIEQSALLMHFDDFDPVDNYSETNWTDSSSNNITLTNTAVGAFTSIVLMGYWLSHTVWPGFANFSGGQPGTPTEERGGVLSERTTALTFGDEWTIEFWFRVGTNALPETAPSNHWTMLSMDSASWLGTHGFDLAFESATQLRLKSWCYREGDNFKEWFDGQIIPVDTWVHCAMVKTLDGVRLFQNGESQGGLGWSDLQTRQADRIGLGGAGQPCE